jgi:hypothetical protein
VLLLEELTVIETFWIILKNHYKHLNSNRINFVVDALALKAGMCRKRNR